MVIRQEKLATLDQNIGESSSIFTGLLLEAFKHHSDPHNSETKCGSRMHKLKYLTMERTRIHSFRKSYAGSGRGRPRLRISTTYKTCSMVMPIPFGIQYFVDILFPRSFVNENLNLSNFTFNGE